MLLVLKSLTSLYVYADGEVRSALAKKIKDMVDLTPLGIIERFDLFSLDLTQRQTMGILVRIICREEINLFRRHYEKFIKYVVNFSSYRLCCRW